MSAENFHKRGGGGWREMVASQLCLKDQVEKIWIFWSHIGSSELRDVGYTFSKASSGANKCESIPYAAVI